MRNDDFKDFFEEDAYNDLLNLYAKEEEEKKKEKSSKEISSKSEHQTNIHLSANKQEPTHSHPAASISQSKKEPTKTPPKFKVEIDGLDEEFHEPKPQKKLVLADLKQNLAKKIEQKIPKKESKDANKEPVIIVNGNENNGVKVKRDFKTFFFQNIRAFIIVIVCLLLSILISTYSISCLNDVFAVRRDSETPIEVNIPLDVDTGDVLKILKDNKLIKHRFFCHLVAKLDKFKSDNYLSGVYYFTPAMGFERMLLNIKQPAKTGETVTLTFPEGFTLDQIMQKLEENKVCTALNIQQVMKTVDFSNEFSFVKALDEPENRYHLLEGYMYPDTYDFYVNENPTSVVRKFLTNFQKKWTKEYAEQAKKMNMSVDDVITLASIIQKESAGADQSPLISSVLHNRLNKSSLYPSLQCDSTTEYIENYIKKNTASASAISTYTAKYSTYKCVGLPVGAICNPGSDAIQAALHPTKSNYYFFAHDVNKKIYLARNDADRRANNIAILNENAKAEKEKTH